MSEPHSETQKRLTRDSVLVALLRILEQKAFSAITITEITKVAGVSRTAFYRNYQIKDDILVLHMNDLFRLLLDRLLQPGHTSKRQRTKIFFLFFQEHRSFINRMISADLTSLFYEQFCIKTTNFFQEQTHKLGKSLLYEKYLPQYIASGLFRILVEWIRNGITESPEELAEFVSEVTGN